MTSIIVSRRLSLVFSGMSISPVTEYPPNQTLFILYNTLPTPTPTPKIKFKKHQNKLNQIQQTYTKKQQTNIETKKKTQQQRENLLNYAY